MKRMKLFLVVIIGLAMIIPVYSVQAEDDSIIPNTLIYEAEDATLTGTDFADSTAGYTGTGYVTGFDNEGDEVVFTINVPFDGSYPLTIKYASPYGDKANYVIVNGSTIGEKVFKQSTTFTDLQAGNVILQAGENTIAIKKSWGYFDVDHIRIGQSEERPPLLPVPATLVNPYSSNESQALMTYLTQIYGGNILSGQQTGVLSELEYVHSLTGKLPAIAGFDMLESDSVDKALHWAQYGGLVAFSWHWRAPLGGNDFYTENTTFDITKAVTPGTIEHDLVIQDIDQIAARLKRLSDAKIPVLWRPLHEAEGGWFWWGAKGAEPCKALYTMLFDRLTNYHKLDNLIWVWTTFTSEQSSDWYPGDASVDIAGVDKYLSDGDYSPLLSDFDTVVKMVQGKKLVTYSENGPMPDPDKLEDFKVGWSYFNTWSGKFILDGKSNKEDHIIKVYNDPYVITLDELPSESIYGKAPVPPPAPQPLPTSPPIPPGYSVFEAEDGSLIGTVKDTSNKGYLGSGYVTGFDHVGDAVEIEVTAEAAGDYRLLVRYASPFGYKKNNLIVNGTNLGEKEFPESTIFKDADMGIVQLRAGTNTIKIETSWGYFDVDALLIKAEQTPDLTPPVTTANVEGPQTNSWHTGDVTIRLNAADEQSEVSITEYSTDGGISWNAYIAPMILSTDGVHLILYRSTDTAGNVEANRTVTVSIDKTAPTYTLLANGREMTGGEVFEDEQAVVIELTADDPLSGVVKETITVDGLPYQEGSVLDFAGKPGNHAVSILITDQAGNATEVQTSLQINTSISSMQYLMDRYMELSELGGPLLPQLTNSLNAAEHHLNKGDQQQAAKHVEDFLKHLTNEPMEGNISANAKAVLKGDADALIALWQ